MTFSLISDEEEVEEMVEKLTGDTSGDPLTNSGKGVVDLMGKVSFSSIVELEKKNERGELLVCLGRGKERGRALGEVEGWWDPTGARGAASLHARHAASSTHGPSAREVRTVRPFRTKTSLLSLNPKLDLPSLQKFHKNLC
jgi:hypothetical protein